MNPTRFALVAALCGFLLSGCGGGLQASQALLEGNWKLDFEATWQTSKDAFLADTLRGADAYSKDPAEKAQQVQTEMRQFLDGTTFGFGKDGALTSNLGKRESKGRYTVATVAERTLSLRVDQGRKQEVEVEFQTADLLHWRIKQKTRDMILVLRRFT